MTHAAVEWIYNPWRERPARAWLSLAIAAGGCLLAASTALPALSKLVLCSVLVGSFGAAFVPVRCRLDESGVTRKSGWFAERREWGSFHRAVRTPEGVLLSPYARRHWLESTRALFLPVPDRAPLSGSVERVLGSHGL